MPVDPELLMMKLKDQVEFYFSARNLQADSYLLGKMDNKLRVHIDVVASFQRVKDLTVSRELLLKALKESPNLTVVEEGGETLIAPVNIRPALRTTLILRDLPEDCTDDTVKALFDTAPISISKQPNNFRYVTFETEEQAAAMHKAVGEKKIGDKWVKARVKNESLSVNMLVAKHHAAEVFQQDFPGGPTNDSFSMYSDPSYGMYMQQSPYGPPAPPPMPMWYEGKGYPGHAEHGKKGGFKKGGGKGGKKGKGYYAQQSHQTPPAKPSTPQFTAEDFPTLVEASGLYEKEVIRWGKEDVIRILGGFTREMEKGRDGLKGLNIKLPATEACCAVLAEPNYTIALTRPVQKQSTAIVDAVKKGIKKPATKPAEKEEKDKPKPKPTEAKAKTPEQTPAAQPQEEEDTATPSPDSPSKKKMTWADAIVTVNDVKVPQPYLQYRAGIAGNTVIAQGGSTQKTEKEKKDDSTKAAPGARKEGRGKGGRGRGETEGRGKGRGGGKGAKGDGEKGARKGKKEGGKKGDTAPQTEQAPVVLPTPQPREVTPPPANSWAAVAMGLAEKKKAAAAKVATPTPAAK